MRSGREGPAPDFSFFIPWRPRVGGFSASRRNRSRRYLQPAQDAIPRPYPPQRRLAVEYRFRFRDPKLYPDVVDRGIYRMDIDNMLKFINDALTGVIWHDDSQIWEMHAIKEFGEVEGIQISVWVIS